MKVSTRYLILEELRAIIVIIVDAMIQMEFEKYLMFMELCSVAHLVMQAFVYPEAPIREFPVVDHIDGDIWNNRLENLRIHPSQIKFFAS